jgi:prephenate dehydrogenase
VNPVRLAGTVRVVGAGLLGTSIGLALSKAGLDVVLTDASPANARLAIDYGAGRSPEQGDNPSVVVVCVPPDVTAAVVEQELAAFPNSTVTDVASVKVQVLKQLKDAGIPLERYVGSHPMAGRERGGAMSARADLFYTRPWVIAAHESSSLHARSAVEMLALDLGATPVILDPQTHDRAVAMVSHVPQLISSLLAARLTEGEQGDISLAGQGLRDTTRIAASDPKLWVQILSANSSEVAKVLRNLAADLEQVTASLESIEAPGALASIGDLLTRGNKGVEQIPGKHGSRARQYSQVVVMIDDKPGQLARLLTEISEESINVEELSLEHSPGAQIGLVELSVLPSVESSLVDALTKRGWRIAG